MSDKASSFSVSAYIRVFFISFFPVWLPVPLVSVHIVSEVEKMDGRSSIDHHTLHTSMGSAEPLLLRVSLVFALLNTRTLLSL